MATSGGGNGETIENDVIPDVVCTLPLDVLHTCLLPFLCVVEVITNYPNNPNKRR